MTALAPTDSTVPAVVAARLTAKRAYHFAAELRSLAAALEAASQRPTDARAAGILEAERVEAVAAGERLAGARSGVAQVGFQPHSLYDLVATLRIQIDMIAAEHAVEPAALRAWSQRWDAFAVRIDP